MSNGLTTKHYFGPGQFGNPYARALEHCTLETEHSARLAMLLLHKAYVRGPSHQHGTHEYANHVAAHMRNLRLIWQLFPNIVGNRDRAAVKVRYRQVNPQRSHWREQQTRRRMSRKQRTRRLRQARYMAELEAEAAYDARQWRGGRLQGTHQIKLETNDKYRHAGGW